MTRALRPRTAPVSAPRGPQGRRLSATAAAGGRRSQGAIVRTSFGDRTRGACASGSLPVTVLRCDQRDGSAGLNEPATLATLVPVYSGVTCFLHLSPE